MALPRRWQQGGPNPTGTPLEDVVTPPSDAFPPGIRGAPDSPPLPPPGAQAPQFSGPELDPFESESGAPGTMDAMPLVSPQAAAGPFLTPEQRTKIKRLQAEHDMHYRRVVLNPREEAEFQKAFRASVWARGFQAQFGQLPDPNDPTYDYRGAWKEDLIPKQAGQHWPDRAPSGRWLKSPYHPTAWMEYYQATTNRDPDEEGITLQQFNMMLFDRVMQNTEGIPPTTGDGGPRGGDGGIGGTQAPAAPDTQVAGLFGFGQKPATTAAPQYTKEEMEYMKGAGVEPGAPAQPHAPPTGGPVPGQAPPPPTRREGDLDRMIREQEEGKGKGTLGEQWKRRRGSKRMLNPAEDEIVERAT